MILKWLEHSPLVGESGGEMVAVVHGSTNKHRKAHATVTHPRQDTVLLRTVFAEERPKGVLESRRCGSLGCCCCTK